MQTIAFCLLGLLAGLYVLVMVAGMISIFPYGLPGLVAMTALGLLLIKVIRERLANKEDDYYSRNVDQ